MSDFLFLSAAEPLAAQVAGELAENATQTKSVIEKFFDTFSLLLQATSDNDIAAVNKATVIFFFILIPPLILYLPILNIIIFMVNQLMPIHVIIFFYNYLYYYCFFLY